MVFFINTNIDIMTKPRMLTSVTDSVLLPELVIVLELSAGEVLSLLVYPQVLCTYHI